MSKRGFGLVLVLMFAAALSAAVVLENIRIDRVAARELNSADVLNRTTQSARLALANLRTAQAAYVAAGQGPDFWVKHASDLSAEIETSLSALQAAASSTDARAHYDTAVSALGALNSLDQKARDNLTTGDRALAGEVIFVDATAAAERLSSELSAAYWAETAAREARTAGLTRQRLATTGGGVAVLLLLASILAGGRRGATVAAPSVAVPVPAPAPPVPAPRPLPVAVRAPAPRVNLSDAAQICVDLARVLDGQDVPPLLERAARVLDAKGLVLWVADPSGAMLRPSLAHGYPDKVLQRLGPLQADADNVTSLAFRSMQVQTLSRQTKGAPNAFAVPLITPTGCVGVLSAEVPEAGAGPEIVSLAKIFAAQLATLVTPAGSSPAQQTAQA